MDTMMMRWGRTLVLALAGLLAASPAVQAREAATDGAGDTRLEAVDRPDDGFRTRVGEGIVLTVAKRRDGAGVADEAIAWELEDPGAGELEVLDRRTRAAEGDDPAGLARVRFMPSRPGVHAIRVASAWSPQCQGSDCRQVAIRLQVGVAPAASAGHGRGAAAALVGAGLAGAALLAATDDGDPAPGARLAITGGDGQSGLANQPLPQPLSVIAYRDGRPAADETIQWSATGGAQLSADSTRTTAGGSALVFVTSLGPAPGPLDVTATLAGSPSASVVFRLVVDVVDLQQVSGDGQAARVDTPFAAPLVVRALRNGSPEPGAGLQWQVVAGSATIDAFDASTDAGGLAQATVTAGPSPGAVVVRVSRTDSAQVFQEFNLLAEELRTLDVVSGDGQSGAQNAALPLPLTVQARDAGVPDAGLPILWSASGGATLSAMSTPTDAGGLASVDVTSMGLGLDPVEVTARRSDNPGIIASFTLPVLPPDLLPFAGDGQAGLAGTQAAQPLQVRLLDGAGAPMAGQTVAWQVDAGGATLDAPVSITDTNGVASVGFRYGPVPGTEQFEASAFGGAVQRVLTATSLPPGALAPVSGDNQAGEPGDPLPLPLVVAITGPGDLSGVPIQFQVLSGSATVSAPEVLTDAAGQAAVGVQLGTTPGPVVVQATAPGGATTQFDLLVNGTLVVTAVTAVSGDGQQLAAGTPSAPMVVELLGNGGPLVGKTVFWSTSQGSLAQPTTVTDADGRTSNTVTTTGAGAVVVTASVPTEDEFVGASLTFTHNAGLASLPGLPVNEASVAEALDAACAALAGAGPLDPGQQDLVDQCQALAIASGSDPVAVNDALGEMLPDVAQTQADAGKVAAGAQFDNLNNRMMVLRSGAPVGPVSFSGLGLVMMGGRLPLADFGNALLSAAPGETFEPGADFGRWGLFLSGNIGRGEADPTRLTPRYDFDVEGLTAGADYRFSDRLVGGVALGYTRQDTELAGGQGSVDTEGLSLSFYGTWYRDNDWYLDGVLTLARNRFDQVRRIQYVLPGEVVDQRATADSSGTDLGTTLTFGRDFSLRGWTLGAYGRLAYTHQRFDAFEEQVDASLPGAGLALRVDERTLDGFTTTLGGKATYAHSASWGVVLPYAELEWVQEHGDGAETFRGFFLDDPTRTPIRVLGDGLDSRYFRAGLGLSMVLGHGRSGFVAYDRIVARSGFSNQTLTLGLRWEF